MLFYRFWTALAVLLISPALASALDSVTVELVNPEGFTDFTLSDTGSPKEVRELSVEWTGFLEAEAAKRITRPGSLTLVFNDIDRAGDFEPWRSVNNPDIRFYRSIYPPRLRFEYRLVDADGAEIDSGEVSLRDMNFELGRSPGYEEELLYYEKIVMRRWLTEFAEDLGASGQENEE